jgi:acetyl/propionyl-CoA carboxylase alpha subunit
LKGEIRLEGSHGEFVVARTEGGVVIDGRALALEVLEVGGRLKGFGIAGRMIPVRAVRAGEVVYVFCDGQTFQFRARPLGAAARPAASRIDADLFAPMPGRVRRLMVREGQSVERGEPLLILEAMKMEHEIRSPRAGRVSHLPVGEGALVDAGTPLVEID